MIMRPTKLGSAGIRGVIGAGLTPENAIDFACAFGTFANGGKVIVALDTRFSSEMLHQAVISGLQSCGCEVHDLGIAPAMLLSFAIPKLKADGGLLIGGGHQRESWNSIVPWGANGAYLNSIQIRELFDIYYGKRFLTCGGDEIKETIPVSKDIQKKYFDALCKSVDTQAIAAANFTVISDFCNGSGSILEKEFASRFNLNSIPINNILSGIMPHDPEPRPHSAFQVQSLVKPLKSDIGFVFNSDMSRVSLVSDTSETLSEECTFPLGVDYLLEKSGKDGLRVVSNICTSKTLDDIVARHNGIIEKHTTGQSNIIDYMKESNAFISGEGSGSFTSTDWLPNFDAFYVSAVILEAMAVKKKTLSELVAELPRYHIVKKTIASSSMNAYNRIRALKSHFEDAEVCEIDGLRLDWADGWVSLRASSTEQLIRLISESKDKELAEDRVLKISALLENLS
jgi:phosphomannomutase